VKRKEPLLFVPQPLLLSFDSAQEPGGEIDDIQFHAFTLNSFMF